MRTKGAAKAENKRDARLWILAAIQTYSVKPTREIEPEVKRFIRRIQRDIVSLNRARIELEKSRQAEIARLAKAQARDEKDRILRFERAILR